MSSIQNSIFQTHHPPLSSPAFLLPPSSTILPSSRPSSLFIPSSPSSSLPPLSPSILDPSSTLHHVSSPLFHPSSSCLPSSSLLFPPSIPLLHPCSLPSSSLQLSPPLSLLAIKSNHIFCSPFFPPFSGYLLIREGLVEGVSEEPPTPEYKVLDRSDDYVIPGLIDLHVHLNATSEWEEIENVTKMAIKGGVTTIFDHPVYNEYDKDMNESKTLKERIEKISSQTYVDVGILAYLGPHNLSDLWNLWENEPILGFNIFLSPCLQSSLPHFDQNQLKILQKTLLNKGNREEKSRRVEDERNKNEEELNRRNEKHSQLGDKMKNNEMQMEEELIKEEGEGEGIQENKKDKLNKRRTEDENGRKERTNGRKMLLSVHPEYATARDLFMSSPLRTKKLEDRLNLELEILDESKFGGGIAGDLDPNESGGDEEEETDDYNDKQLVPPSITRSRLLKRLSFKNAKKQEEQGISRLEMIGYSLNEEETETIRREEEEEEGGMKEEGERRIEEEGRKENDGFGQERLVEEGRERSVKVRRRGDGEEGGGEWEEEILTSSSDEEEVVDQENRKKSAAIDVEKMKVIWNKDGEHGEQSKEPKSTFKTNILINEIREILDSLKRNSPTLPPSPTLSPTNQCLSSTYPNPAFSCSPSLLSLSPFPLPISTPPCSLLPIPSNIPSSSSSSLAGLTSLSPPQSPTAHLSLFERRKNLSKSLGPIDKSFLHDFHIDIREVKKKKTEIISKNNEKTNRDYNFFLYNHSLSWEMNGIKLCLRNFKKIKQANILFNQLSSTSSAFEVQEKKKCQNFLPFYTEITIPFLCFHRKLIKPGKTKFKNSPPIRDKETRDLIIEGLLVDDLIHIISSGHNTQDPKFKKVDHSNFRRAVNGISCIGCNLNVVWSTLYSKWKNAYTVEELIQRTISLTSYNAALLGGLSHNKGSLLPGKQADFVIWKPFKVNLKKKGKKMKRNC